MGPGLPQRNVPTLGANPDPQAHRAATCSGRPGRALSRVKGVPARPAPHRSAIPLDALGQHLASAIQESGGLGPPPHRLPRGKELSPWVSAGKPTSSRGRGPASKQGQRACKGLGWTRGRSVAPWAATRWPAAGPLRTEVGARQLVSTVVRPEHPRPRDRRPLHVPITPIATGPAGSAQWAGRQSLQARPPIPGGLGKSGCLVCFPRRAEA